MIICIVPANSYAICQSANRQRQVACRSGAGSPHVKLGTSEDISLIGPTSVGKYGCNGITVEGHGR